MKVGVPKVWNVVYILKFYFCLHFTTLLFGAFPSEYCLGMEKCLTSYIDIEGVSSFLSMLLGDKAWAYNLTS